MKPDIPSIREDSMKKRAMLIAALLLACGCTHTKQTLGVTMVVQMKDQYHVTQKPPELRIEYKVEGPFLDKDR
jgi:hypothetical protein